MTTDVETHTGLLGNLARRRQEIQQELTVVFPVPRWENPEIKLRCKPVENKILEKGIAATEKLMKDKNTDKMSENNLNVNADLIVNACVEIFCVLPDGTEMGFAPDGSLTGFGPDVSVTIGLSAGASARATCRALFFTDADLLTTAKALSEWSGYREQEVDEELAGE